MLFHAEAQFWLPSSSMFKTCDVSCIVRGFLCGCKGDDFVFYTLVSSLSPPF